MQDFEIRQLIRQEIQEALAPILMAVVKTNETVQRMTAQRFSSEGPIKNIRNIQPWGFASRATTGSECVLVPVMNDPSHINCLGHFDKTKPECADGESIQYDAFSHIVYLSQSKMQFGSKGSANPMMLGDIVQTLLSSLIQLIAVHQHVGNLGYLTSPPQTSADFLNLKTSPVDDGKIISAKCFTEK